MMPNGYQPQVTAQYQSPIDPEYQKVLRQYLAGTLSPAQQQYLAQERERGLGTLRETYGARGAPTGAAGAAERRYLGDVALRSALLAGQQQQMGLQYGMPYMQYGAQQYWMPERMAQTRYGLGLRGEQLALQQRLGEYQMQERPWYLDVLGAAGGLAGTIITPWAQQRLTGGAGGGGGQRAIGG
jgi:hypothetical protein